MGGKEKENTESYQVRLSLKATKGFNDITSYISVINHQPLNSVRVADQLVKRINTLADNPFAFKECAELKTKSGRYRIAVLKSWQIIFRIKKFDITVLGILHVSQHPSIIRSLRKIK